MTENQTDDKEFSSSENEGDGFDSDEEVCKEEIISRFVYRYLSESFFIYFLFNIFLASRSICCRFDKTWFEHSLGA